MITCVVHYVIDADRLDAFEEYARRWTSLVAKYGGSHHGYYLPAEGASDRAICLFSFDSLAKYESYRVRVRSDPDFDALEHLRRSTGCVVRYDRSFYRPL